jgi:hypothetical protein
MATTKVREIIGRVEDVLKDANVRWPRLELQRWLNDGYGAILGLKPDANTKTVTHACTAGTRQEIKTANPDAIRFRKAKRNVAATSNNGSITQIDSAVLDKHQTDWHTHTQSVNIQHYMHDPDDPNVFWVYPPATSAAEVEVVYLALPAPHAMTVGNLDPASSSTDTIRLDDVYVSPLVDFILYRAFMKDGQNASNLSRANVHLQAFSVFLSSKTSTDAAVAPIPES